MLPWRVTAPHLLLQVLLVLLVVLLVLVLLLLVLVLVLLLLLLLLLLWLFTAGQPPCAPHKALSNPPCISLVAQLDHFWTPAAPKS